MIKFYHSIDCLVVLSITEAMPRIILEAMACGLPVISTDTGSVRMLLDKDWIVPIYPEKEAIKQMNKKLDLLKKDPQLRKKIGERNRKHIEQFFSWNKNQALWDEVYNALCIEDYKKIEILTNNYLKPFEYICKDLKQKVDKEKEIKFKSFKVKKRVNKKSKKIEKEKIYYFIKNNMSFDKVINDLKNKNITPILLKTSCLNAIRFGILSNKSTQLHLAVSNLKEHKQLFLFLNNSHFRRINYSKINNRLTICLHEVWEKDTKFISLFNKQIKVPFPVIHYLRKHYGDNWKTWNLK